MNHPGRRYPVLLAMGAWLNAVMLHFYPESFKSIYGDEMRVVFANLVARAAQRGMLPLAGILLRELRDYPAALFRIYKSSLSSKGVFVFNKRFAKLFHPDPPGSPAWVQPESWGSTILGTLPFLVGPFVYLLGRIFLTWNQVGAPGGQSIIDNSTWLVIMSFIVLAVALIFMIILVISWTREFPRWSLAYWTWAIFISMILSGSATPGFVVLGYTFQPDDIWGARALIPLAAVVLIGLALTRSYKPYFQFFNTAIRDWTRLSFLMYSLLPILVRASYEGVQGDEPLLLAFDLILTAGAVLYFRSANPWVRLASLGTSLLVIWSITAVFLGFYWDGRQLAWMPEPADGMRRAIGELIGMLVMLTILLAPAVLSLFPRDQQPIDA